MSSALKFKHASVPRQQSEQARLKVVQGPDFGTVFVITGVRATLGRGEESDVILSDLKASRMHAEVALSDKGSWSVRDLGSANGILVNGNPSAGAILKFHDTITLGETMLEFLASDSATRVLASPARSLMEVKSQQVAFEEQRRKAQGIAGPSGAAKGQERSPEKEMKKGLSPLLILAIAAGAALWLYNPASPPQQAGLPGKSQGQSQEKAASEKSAQTRDLASYLPSSRDPAPISKTAEMFFRSGFREFEQGNYLRAKLQFETALQILPTHELARLYLDNCDRAIEDEVKFHLQQGKKGLDSGMLKEAHQHFEAVLRLLYRDQSNDHFKEAKEQLQKMDEDKTRAFTAGGAG